jgi:transcriptional regulator with XRE-family HTH domain
VNTKSPVQEAFGQAMRDARLAAGMSQEELGELAELHRTYIGDIERGERNVSLLNMHNLATALKIKLSLLVENMETRMAKSSASKKTPSVADTRKPQRIARLERVSRKP